MLQIGKTYLLRSPVKKSILVATGCLLALRILPHRKPHKPRNRSLPNTLPPPPPPQKNQTNKKPTQPDEEPPEIQTRRTRNPTKGGGLSRGAGPRERGGGAPAQHRHRGDALGRAGSMGRRAFDWSVRFGSGPKGSVQKP